MYYTLPHNIRVASFQNDSIFLDITKDKYWIVEGLTASGLNELFTEEAERCSASLLGSVSFIELIRTNHKPNTINFKQFDPAGFLDERWSPSKNRPSITESFFWQAPFAIMNAGRLLKNYGINAIAKAATDKKPDCHIPHQDVHNAMNSIGYWFFLDRTDNKCLAHAVSAKLLMRKFGSRLKIAVGVRTRPFLSHAWLELDGKVIADDSSLPNKLSTIWKV